MFLRRGLSWRMAIGGLVLLGAACTARNPAWVGPTDAQSAPAPGGMAGTEATGAGEGGQSGGASGQGGVSGDGPAGPGMVGGGAGSPPSMGGAAGGGGGLAIDAAAMSVDVSASLAADASLPPPDVDPRPTQGLVVSLPFDEAPSAGTLVTDSTGENSAELHHIVWSTEHAPGVTGTQALQFDGTSSYVDLDIPALPRSEADKSVALWYRYTGQTSALRTLLAFFTTSQVEDLGIQLGFDGVSFAAWRFGRPTSEATGPSTLNAWHHGAYTYTASTNIHRLYVDGQQVATFTGAMKSGAFNVARLGTYVPPDELWKGQLNDLRIYDRVLSAAEIATLAKP